MDDEGKRKTKSVFGASKRIANLVKTVAVIATDYIVSSRNKQSSNEYDALLERLQQCQTDQEKFTLLQWKSKDKREEAHWKSKIVETRCTINETSTALAELVTAGGSSSLSQLHTRCALKLRNLCIENKGVYIKLGQHLSQLDHILPLEYTENLRPLLANNPTSSWESVKRVIEQDLHASTDELWASVEHEPIACASLAQVHVARGKNGKKYAVKVQHEGLLEGSEGDMIAITFIVGVISRLFEGFSYNWLTREMNKNLPEELDFRREADNAVKCSKLLKNLVDSGDVVIPEIEKASRRVICMSFEEGKYISDTGAIEKMGLCKADIARIISKTFCQQMYQHGFVHCDPHEANLLVRPRPGYPGLI